MAGRGPAPKDPGKRARRNGEPPARFIIEFVPGSQPKLPNRMPLGFPWPARTRAWWRMWAKSELAKTFTANDWSELLDTAVLHGLFWSGRMDVAGELRLRVSKFGATPEDRARLRIQFADADEKESKRAGSPTVPASRARYGDLKVVGDDRKASGE